MLLDEATVLFLLMVGHFIADYPLQGDFLAKAKNRYNPIPGVPWYHALTAHCFIHAGAVFFITGHLWAALIEFMCHFAIDDMKCAGNLTYNQDQFLHILTKLLIVLVAVVFI